MRKMIRQIAVLLLCCASAIPVRAACDWPEWEQFKRDYITAEGRVIDPSDARRITTSEGQSYALFFSLVNDDRETFEQVLNWTERELAKGDLTGFLPAWLWGKQEDKWGILDANSAADSDLWIAYSLLEAGRLWQNHSYESIGTMLLRRIAREEVARVPGLGLVLLPGPRGFATEQRWTLNPAYVPPQLLARVAGMQGPWQEMHKQWPAILMASSPNGFAPDWVDWQPPKGWVSNDKHGGRGSYDAIRVYLWLGMLSTDDPVRQQLVAHFAPIQAYVNRTGLVPEQIDTATGKVEGQDVGGFAAALLPLMQGEPALDALRAQVSLRGWDAHAYYGSVLTLFGAGWDQGRYRFAANGNLIPRWSKSCLQPE
ncbi:cellulose synthase complex periplasmic endoglucanase BcsZ [Aeromonas allosaccharophila]|uniref:cellulose synthase complex periplasmic endoglucanase BcsZ n=1 Tax=Aeromonas allosaccharophila TaxID=656 RepID=UPI0005A895DA|nr:cellulose synthase complex periplasmic endoglucanase BcsZ [Aeromonas allosaccharophila]